MVWKGREEKTGGTMGARNESQKEGVGCGLLEKAKIKTKEGHYHMDTVLARLPGYPSSRLPGYPSSCQDSFGLSQFLGLL